MKPILPIHDLQFCHAFSSSDWHKPSHFDWSFNKLVEGKDYTFLTDYFVARTDEFPNHRKFLWLVESPGIMREKYNFALDNIHKYDLVFSHNDKILERAGEKGRLLPIGGCHLSDDEIGLHKSSKTKLVSMIFSGQNWLPGHQMRHSVYSLFGNKIDCMGSGLTGQKLRKVHACKDYKFQIVIENVSEGYYFTEKIIDSFLSGCIPIYWGCPHISEFFDTSGFLIFNSMDELGDILNSDLDSFWERNQEAIAKNFNLALKYKVAEDYLWENYQDIL